MEQQQTYQNIMFLAGLEALKRLAAANGWSHQQEKLAVDELAKRYHPNLAVF